MRSAPGSSTPQAPPRGWRLGSWHSYRWLWWFAGLVTFLIIPWRQAPPGQIGDLVTVNVTVGLAWAIPVWRTGVIVDQRGVRFVGLIWSRRFRWEQIDSARIARIGIEPRLRLDLLDGNERWAPGFVIPYAQACSRQDGWRSTEMFRAAQLITDEAERRRREQPPDGMVVPLPRTLTPASGHAAA